MLIRIPFKSLPCPHQRFAKKMLYECLACSRYVSHDKARGFLLCGDEGSNDCIGNGGFSEPPTKWDIVKSYGVNFDGGI